MTEQSAVQVFRCSECNIHYKHRQSLATHVRCKHQTKLKKFQCQLCRSSFNLQWMLARHIRTVHKSELKRKSVYQEPAEIDKTTRDNSPIIKKKRCKFCKMQYSDAPEHLPQDEY